MHDSYGRNIDYMRISITDRCNLRCRYCMPHGIEQIAMTSILTYEEIVRVCQNGVKAGITKLRVTGGEPLVRRDCPKLVSMLKEIPGIQKVSLTTNGSLLDQYGDKLKKAGLDGVNISLDTTSSKLYREITGRDELKQVMIGMESMIKLEIPVKINAVLMAGVNDGEWESLVDLARQYPVHVRFIELMPIGFGKNYQGISSDELLKNLRRKYPDVTADTKIHGNGPAAYYSIPGFRGSVGFISAIHGKFCSECNRLRLTAEGKLKPCLCYGDYTDLRAILRGDSEEDLLEGIKQAIAGKPFEHCFDCHSKITEKQKMSKIGG